MWDLTGHQGKGTKLFCSWELDTPPCSPTVGQRSTGFPSDPCLHRSHIFVAGCLAVSTHGNMKQCRPVTLFPLLWHGTQQPDSECPFEKFVWVYLIFNLIQTHKSELVASFGEKDIDNYLLCSHIRNQLWISQIIELQFYSIISFASVAFTYDFLQTADPKLSLIDKIKIIIKCDSWFMEAPSIMLTWQRDNCHVFITYL